MKLRQVAGGLIFQGDELLLVRNDRHYSKTSDWSTPGGVINRGETVVEGLTREVLEETGLKVDVWEGPVYFVQVDFVDRGFILEVRTFLAESWAGDIVLKDPDSIVTDAAFCSLKAQADLLEVSPLWVREPLLEWQQNREKEMKFQYQVSGTGLEDFNVSRTG